MSPHHAYSVTFDINSMQGTGPVHGHGSRTTDALLCRSRCSPQQAHRAYVGSSGVVSSDHGLWRPGSLDSHSAHRV